MGPHFYDGSYIKRYQIQVCGTCWSGNYDGWQPDCERRLILHLEKEGVPIPDRNEKGLLPRG